MAELAAQMTWPKSKKSFFSRIKIKSITGWSLIIALFLFKLMFLYATGIPGKNPVPSFFFLRPQGISYWAIDLKYANPAEVPGYQAIVQACAAGHGIRLPFSLPLASMNFLVNLALPILGFTLIYSFNSRLKWWHLALIAICLVSMCWQNNQIKVFTPATAEKNIFLWWGEDIRQASQKTGVSEALLASVMLQESSGQPDAISHDPMGNPVAYGLMQLIPSTAARFGLPQQRILDPQTNIMAGAEYLALLNKDFDGRLELVLAGYYAGEHAVSSALTRAGITPKAWTSQKWPIVNPYLPRAFKGQPSVEEYVESVEKKYDMSLNYLHSTNQYVVKY